ncbi:hypothetical protein BAH_B0127 (plasmid) [Bacillus anthracis str. A0442]|nr:hypothetical protein BAH_B0127 [Bacillus anthracis str. A0442]
MLPIINVRLLAIPRNVFIHVVSGNQMEKSSTNNKRSVT